MSLFDIPTIFFILIIINLDKYHTVCCYELFPIVDYFDSQNMTQLFLYTFLSIKIVQSRSGQLLFRFSLFPSPK